MASSLPSLPQTSLFVIELFASPCTIIELDCTPTFPAIAIMSGMKRASCTFLVSSSSKPPITSELAIPPANPMISQGRRALVLLITVSEVSFLPLIPESIW